MNEIDAYICLNCFHPINKDNDIVVKLGKCPICYHNIYRSMEDYIQRNKEKQAAIFEDEAKESDLSDNADILF